MNCLDESTFRGTLAAVAPDVPPIVPHGLSPAAAHALLRREPEGDAVVTIRVWRWVMHKTEERR